MPACRRTAYDAWRRRDGYTRARGSISSKPSSEAPDAARYAVAVRLHLEQAPDAVRYAVAARLHLQQGRRRREN